MDCNADRYEEVCCRRFDHIDAKLDRIDLALRGNSISPGMQVRLDRLEQLAGLRGKLFLLGCGAGVTAGVVGLLELLRGRGLL